MGGFGSGRWQEGKALTKQRAQLDIRKLQRPSKAFGTHFQSWPGGSSIWLGFDVSHADVKTRLPGHDPHHCRIELVTNAQHFGGHRTWWKCPCCQSRVGVLYWEGWRWQCRKCAGLVHESTRQTEDTLAYKRVNKIREKLGWGGGLCSPMGSRPKGMHWRTYARLIQELNDASLAAAGASADRIDMLTERLLKNRILK